MRLAAVVGSLPNNEHLRIGGKRRRVVGDGSVPGSNVAHSSLTGT
jgi:hypothetical protein